MHDPIVNAGNVRSQGPLPQFPRFVSFKVASDFTDFTAFSLLLLL